MNDEQVEERDFLGSGADRPVLHLARAQDRRAAEMTRGAVMCEHHWNPVEDICWRCGAPGLLRAASGDH